jgi:predicted transcriptional regulator
MSKFQDHPVFASNDPRQAPLSSTELGDLRKMLERDKKRQPISSARDFTDGIEEQVNHARLAERVYKARRERERVFNDDIFADPAWDLLLDLFVRTARNEQISVSSACHGANVPEATALRYLKVLTERKYVERFSHPNDKRSTTLKMTPLGNRLMIEWLEHCRSHR